MTEQSQYGSDVIESPRRLPARDPLRDEEWFGEQIGKSADWCRKNRVSLPHHVIGGSARYDDHCVDLYREQTFQPPMDPLARPKSEPALASVGLLSRSPGSRRHPAHHRAVIG